MQFDGIGWSIGQNDFLNGSIKSISFSSFSHCMEWQISKHRECDAWRMWHKNAETHAYTEKNC